jgi:L-asparaginase/N4-(beta-N-acetylglucosaminyl)-L-asparaginase
MTDRRNFLKLGALASAMGGSLLTACSGGSTSGAGPQPIVISTWPHGEPANEAAWTVLSDGGSALDAVEAGVRVPEADPEVHTVGYGGFPDRSGTVTLDACIMDGDGRAGSVAFLSRIMHPISVARKVMEETPHVMLVGDGALDFARAQGFEEQSLLTDDIREQWDEWNAQNPDAASTAPEVNVESEVNVQDRGGAQNHDTIGMLALDADGTLAGACTTSGTKWKMPGRVGDSPLIGSGLYVDPDAGAACATGWGEHIIRTVGSHAVVERMRQGATPEAACRDVVDRILARTDAPDIQVGFLALTPRGETGAYSIASGFDVATYDPENGNRLTEAPHRR